MSLDEDGYRRTEPSRIGLVLAGGGARGAYQVGVLKAIAELTHSNVSPFSIISGVSVGAINAAALASRAENFDEGVSWLECLWANLHARNIYQTDVASVFLCGLHWLLTIAFGGFGIKSPNALLDAAPLRNLLANVINFDDVAKAIKSERLDALAITASSYADGRAKTFFQGKGEIEAWSRARRDGLPTTINIDHIMASTALPFIFQPRRIDGEYFGDGAVRLTAPLSPAIRLGARKILVIANRDEKRDAQAVVEGPPKVGDIVGYLLDVLFNDNLNADIERIKRINATLTLLPKEKRDLTPLREIEVRTIRPSADLRDIAGKHAAALPWTIKLLLRGIGGWGPDWRVTSYLLFERPYCRALIDLGYQDAMDQRNALQEFFGTA